MTLKENENETLTVDFIELLSSTKVIWSSSDEKIVTVENGKVTAKGIGTAIITVATEDGKYQDTCTVSVIKKETSTVKTPDDTVVKGEIPKAGISKIMISAALILVVTIFLSCKHYRRLKNI